MVSGGPLSYAREFAPADGVYTQPGSNTKHQLGVLRSSFQDLFLDVTLGNGATFTAGGLPAAGNLTLTGGTGGAVTISYLSGGNAGDSKITWFVDVTAGFAGFPEFTLETTGWKIRDGGNVLRGCGDISITIAVRDAGTGIPVDSTATDTTVWLQGASTIKTVLVPTTASLAVRTGYRNFVATPPDSATQDNGATLELAFTRGILTPTGVVIDPVASDSVTLKFAGPLEGIYAFTWNPESGGFAASATHFVTADDVTAKFAEITIAGDVVGRLGAGARGLKITIDGNTVLDPRTINLSVRMSVTVGSAFTADLLAATPVTVWSYDGLPVPTLTSISPTSATAGAPQLTLTLSGTNFISSSTVRWNFASRATTFVSATELRAVVPASDLAQAGTFGVGVFNPAPGGGSSQLVNFQVNNPVPVLTLLAPSSAAAGSAPPTVTVTGQNFTPASVVRWAGSDRTTTFVSGTALQFAPTTADLATAGDYPVTVFTPTPGGGTSASRTFSVTALVPTLTTLAPSSTFAGASGLTLTLTGANFTAQSTVQWNGSARATTFVSSSVVTAAILAADLAAPGTASVTVANAGGSPSAALLFTIVAAGPRFDIQMSKSAYAAGEAVVASQFRLRNPSSSATAVELKVWLEIPGNAPISILNLGSDGSLMLPPALDLDLGPLTLFGSTTGLPTGTYSFSSRSLDPASAELLYEDLNPFTIGGSTAPVPADGTEAADAPPVFLLTLSKSTYTTGEVVTAVEARLENPGTATASPEVKLWLRAPSGPATGVLTLGAQGELTLPAGANINLGTLAVLGIVATTPRGEHEMSTRVVDPVTGKFLSEDRNPFVVQ